MNPSYRLVSSVLFALFITVSFGATAVFADTITTSSTATTIAAPRCYTMPNNLRYGADDATSQGSVTTLQSFLSTQGFFDSSLIGSGHFGPMTLKSVIRFQASQGLPTTGYVGPMTRAAIAAIEKDCGGTPPPTETAPNLYSLSPTSGVVGTTVTVTGFGFTDSNTILLGGSLVARDVPISSTRAIACTTNSNCHGGINQTLTFTVPSSLSPNCPAGSMCPLYMRLVTPGQYDLTVVNSTGTSNALTFTVTAANSQPLSISGLDTPSSLTIGQTGTWTVHTAARSDGGNLHYSAMWGDEINTSATAAIVAPQPATTQTSATFTHSYRVAGTYTPTFTVSDDNGNTVSSTNTITVTPVYYY